MLSAPSLAPSPPSQCRNATRCARLSKQQLLKLPAAIALHEAFLEHQPHSIIASEHAVGRMAERGFSYEEVVSVVECCEPVEWSDFQESVARVEGIYGSLATDLFRLRRYGLRIKGETTDGHPLIVVCRCNAQPLPGTSWEMRITTAYDPSERAHQWARGYTHRICFCSEEGEEGHPRGVEDLLLAGGRNGSLVYTSEPCL